MTLLDTFCDDLPVVPGEVEAWRAWVVLTAGYREPRLRSLYFDTVWPTDAWLLAEGDHGICAARDREHLVSMHRWGDRGAPRYVTAAEVTAIGRVGLAGVVIPGERGYRAERARPLSLLLPYAHWELVESLRRAYRVPVGLSNVLIEGGSVRGHRS
jgi:hypothetical protein